MKDGVRVINCARGELLVDEALKDALDSGKVAGAALDVFPAEPITDYPLFDGYDNVVVTPHLGASTTEAQDRAGVQTAEQVVAALTGGVVSTAVNIPAVSAPRTWRCSARTCRSCSASAASPPRSPRAAASSASSASTSATSRAATRACSRSRRSRACSHGHTEEEVNLVNAPSLAEERGIEVAETKELVARDFTDLVRITVGRRAPRGRHHARPAPPPAPARGLGPALQPPARRRPLRALPLLRPARHGRPRRHLLRRARHQHLPGRGRPRAARARTATATTSP